MKIRDLMEDNNNLPFYENFTTPLWHGTKLDAGEYEFKPRNQPRDTFLPIHNTIAKLSEEKLGINVRSLIFANFTRHETEPYGIPMEIVPKGNDYRLFYVDGIQDMTQEYAFSLRSVEGSLSYLIKQAVSFEVSRRDYGVIKEMIKNHYHKKFSGNFMEFMGEIIKEVKMILSRYDEEYSEEKLDLQLKDYADRVMENITDYVEFIEEVKTDGRITDSDFEIMVYCPSGFIIN